MIVVPFSVPFAIDSSSVDLPIPLGLSKVDVASVSKQFWLPFNRFMGFQIECSE